MELSKSEKYLKVEGLSIVQLHHSRTVVYVCTLNSVNLVYLVYYGLKVQALHKKCLIRVFSWLYFPAFELNTERYGISLRIQSKCGKIRTKKTPNMDTFHAAVSTLHSFIKLIRSHRMKIFCEKDGIKTLQNLQEKILSWSRFEKAVEV